MFKTFLVTRLYRFRSRSHHDISIDISIDICSRHLKWNVYNTFHFMTEWLLYRYRYSHSTTRCTHQASFTCCSVLQCVAMSCSVLQCVAVCCSVSISLGLLHIVAHSHIVLIYYIYYDIFITSLDSPLFVSTEMTSPFTHRNVVCQVIQSYGHTATHCNTLQHTATHCNTLQHTASCSRPVIESHVTVCCKVLQCVAESATQVIQTYKTAISI